jgi:aminomethyltransferase
MLNEQGKFIDDCIVFRISPNAFFVVHGAGAGHDVLTRSTVGRDVALLFDDDLHDLSLQGPLAVEFLADHIDGIRQLRYFHHLHTQLFGRPVMISRTGYTGERGYEIFCKREDAPAIWDTILELGAPLGIIPCAFTTLDWLRVESYLLFYPYDNSEMYPFQNEPPGDTLWELGLDFTVTPGKTGFRGEEEHRRLEGKERFKIFGVAIDGDEAAAEGDTLWRDGCEVGVITCAMYSHLSSRSMALARLTPDSAVDGTRLEVKGSIAAQGVAAKPPFYDPEKTRRIAMD